MTNKPLLLRVAIIAFAALAIALVAFHVHLMTKILEGAYPGLSISRPNLFKNYAQLVITFADAAFALYIAWRVRADVGILTGGLYLVLLGLSPVIPSGMPGHPVFAEAPFIRAGLMLIASIAVIRFTQLLPQPVSATDITTALGHGRMRRLLARLAIRFLDQRLLYISLAVAIAVALLTRSPGVSAVIGIFIAVLGVTYLYTSFRLGSAGIRRSIFWLLENALAQLIMHLIVLAFALYNLLLHPQWNTVYVTSIVAAVVNALQLFFVSMAIFHSGEIDSGLLVKRTAVISAAAGVVLVLFVAVEQLITNTVQTRLGVQGNTAGIAAGVVAAFAFGPVHARLKRAMDAFVSRFDTRPADNLEIRPT